MQFHVPRQAFKIMDKKIVQTYSKTFQGRDDRGRVFCCGHTSISKKLIKRNIYLNRPHMKNTSPFLGSNLGNRLLSITAGAIECQPTVIPLNETLESLNEKMWLLVLFT